MIRRHRTARAAPSALLAALAAGGCLSSPEQGGGAGEPPDGCGTMRALRDDFEDESIDLERWYGERATIDGGAVELWATADTRALLISEAEYLLRDGEVVVELFLDDLDPDSSMAMWLYGGGGALGLQLHEGRLELIVNDEDATRVVASATDDGASWWRLREEDGVVEAATSVDGDAWGDLGSTEWPAATLVSLELLLEGNTAESTVDVRSVNAASPPEPLCPIASLIDEFDDLARWYADDGDGCASDGDGALRISIAEPVDCGVRTRQLFALRESEIAVELADLGDCVPAAGFAVVDGEAGYQVLCYDVGEGPRLNAETRGGEEEGSLPYDPEAHRFVRIRHDPAEGGMVWETRPADGDWQQFGAAAVDGALDEANLDFFVIAPDGPEDVGEVAFDRLNLAP